MLSRVVGPPGCGKTTYLSRQVRLAYEAGHGVMVCSLTRTAAAEIAGRDLPIPKDMVGTLHSHAYRSLRSGKLEIADDGKWLSEWNESHPTLQLSGGRTIDEDTHAPGHGQPTEADISYLDYNRERAKRVPRALWRQSTAHFATTWEAWKGEHGLLDFTDLLERALDSAETAPGNPSVVFADEAQDFSALEMALLTKWGAAAGRLVLAGDPWQSLYEWRGADAAQVFPSDAIDRVLDQSYRVPSAVHAAAMNWVRRMPGWTPIEYRPVKDAEGEVRQCMATVEWPQRAADVLERAVSDGKTAMYLAACGRMLRPMLQELRRRGVPFHNPFRKSEGGWNPLQRRSKGLTSGQRLYSFLKLGMEGHWTREDVERWIAVIKGSDTFPGGNSSKKLETIIAQLPERQPIDQGIWETMLGEEAVEASMAADYEWWMEHLLASRRETMEYPVAIAKARGPEALNKDIQVVVGTIHSVKGGEADVVVLAPDVSVPGAMDWSAGDAGKASIYRLFYVGMTRAKESLHIMQPAKQALSVRLI